MPINFYTGRNLRAYGKKFTGIRIEIYAQPYAFSRENEKLPEARRSDHFQNLRKQSPDCEMKCH